MKQMRAIIFTCTGYILKSSYVCRLLLELSSDNSILYFSNSSVSFENIHHFEFSYHRRPFQNQNRINHSHNYHNSIFSPFYYSFFFFIPELQSSLARGNRTAFYPQKLFAISCKQRVANRSFHFPALLMRAQVNNICCTNACMHKVQLVF